jgi:hypothetical protein
VPEEIEITLSSGIPTIPVLLQDLQMPYIDELPLSIAHFTAFPSIEVADSQWDFDMERLVRGIDDLMIEMSR